MASVYVEILLHIHLDSYRWILIALAHAPLYFYTSEPDIMQRVESKKQKLIFLINKISSDLKREFVQNSS